jgi:hypothetical protein
VKKSQSFELQSPENSVKHLIQALGETNPISSMVGYPNQLPVSSSNTSIALIGWAGALEVNTRSSVVALFGKSDRLPCTGSAGGELHENLGPVAGGAVENRACSHLGRRGLGAIYVNAWYLTDIGVNLPLIAYNAQHARKIAVIDGGSIRATTSSFERFAIASERNTRGPADGVLLMADDRR